MTAVSAETPQERILAAARQVFAAKGFRGGSLNDVAVLAGYTRAGLLHHFPSKEAMLLALLEQRDAQMASLVPDESEEIGVFTLLRRLSDPSDLILRDRELVQLAHVLTAEASGSDHPAREWVARRQARYRRILARSVRYSIAHEGLTTDIDPELLAAVIFGMFEGLEAQWLLDPGVSPTQGHRLLLTLLEKIVSKNPTNQ